MATLEARKATLTIEVADLLKQNDKLLEDKRKDKVEIDSLKKMLGEA